MTLTKRLHPSVLALVCLLPACDPDAKNLGEDLEEGEGAWAVDWRVSSAVDSILYGAAPTADGGVVVLERNQLEGYGLLQHYAADGTLQWANDAGASTGGSLATGGSAIFLAAERQAASEVSRASLRRFSGAGVVEREYVQAREGDSNSFSRDVAASADEVAIVIGNWGTPAYEGEPQFEVQRLDHDLQPIGEPLGFDSEVAEIAYDASGDLVILEVPDEGPARVHRPLSGAEPALVDCVSLLTSSGAPLCANGVADFRLTNYETGEIQELGALGLQDAGPSRSTRSSSTVFAAAFSYDGLVEVVEVLDDGAEGRRAAIPLSSSGFGGVPVSVQQLGSGAVYVIAIEHMEGEPCPDPDGQCFESHLLRLAAD